jgi:hypothetical protein
MAILANADCRGGIRAFSPDSQAGIILFAVANGTRHLTLPVGSWGMPFRRGYTPGPDNLLVQVRIK